MGQKLGGGAGGKASQYYTSNQMHIKAASLPFVALGVWTSLVKSVVMNAKQSKGKMYGCYFYCMGCKSCEEYVYLKLIQCYFCMQKRLAEAFGE